MSYTKCKLLDAVPWSTREVSVGEVRAWCCKTEQWFSLYSKLPPLKKKEGRQWGRNCVSARKVKVGEMQFDSASEARYYFKLLKVVDRVERQPSVDVVANGVKLFTYTADFRVIHEGIEWWVDYKYKRCRTACTEVSWMKMRIVEMLYNELNLRVVSDDC